MKTRITAERYHDISCGHRVAGHESKCKHLHGHNYRITFVCEADALDGIGRVMDFSVIKSKLCMWLEDRWDHKFLVWVDDPLMDMLCNSSLVGGRNGELATMLDDSLVWTSFNPTAENMAAYLLNDICPMQLQGTGVVVTEVVVEETRKCSATASARRGLV